MLCIVNYLYHDGKPFAIGYNQGNFGYLVSLVSSSCGLYSPIHFSSFGSFLSNYTRDFISTLSLGVPFPFMFNSSSSDVK